jgi:hypothetical protein
MMVGMTRAKTATIDRTRSPRHQGMSEFLLLRAALGGLDWSELRRDPVHDGLMTVGFEEVAVAVHRDLQA